MAASREHLAGSTGAGLQDLIGRLQDPLRRPLGNRIPGAPPVLDVTAAELDAWKAEGGAAEEIFASPRATIDPCWSC
jgi:hypothetical protein